MYDAIFKVIKVLQLTKEMTLKLWWSKLFNNLIKTQHNTKRKFQSLSNWQKNVEVKKEVDTYAQVIY
jgi:hypothetical protein